MQTINDLKKCKVVEINDDVGSIEVRAEDGTKLAVVIFPNAKLTTPYFKSEIVKTLEAKTIANASYIEDKKLAYLSSQLLQMAEGMKISGPLALYTVTHEEVEKAARIIEALR